MSYINTVLRQALKTFKNRALTVEAFKKNFQQLKAIVDSLQAEHVNLDSKFQQAETWTAPNKAPVSYIEIYQDQYINVSIFVLKPNMIMPLHDHPQMHGLLKVISGSVQVESYSKSQFFFAEDESIDYERRTGELLAKKNNTIFASETSECCVLEPNKNNFHEIRSVDGPSAFFDILAPPYDVLIPEFGPRKCTYYHPVKEIAPTIYELIETPAPSWFWADNFPYEGPELIVPDFDELDDEIVKNA